MIVPPFQIERVFYYRIFFQKWQTRCCKVFRGFSAGMACCLPYTTCTYLFTIQKATMLTIILLLSGLVCFWLFYKAADWFEKI